MKKVITAGITAAIIAGFSMASHAAPVKDMNVDISGVGQIVNSWQEGLGKNDGLDLRRMRLTVKADPAEKVSFSSTLELTKNSTGDSKITDMYVDLKYVPQVTLRVGQFKLPNSYELLRGVYEKDLVNDTRMSFSMRDRGLMLSGSPIKELSWAITATNGTGTGTGGNVNTDDGDSYLGQLNYMPLENLSFKIWLATEKDSAGVPATTDALGLGFDYTISGLHLYGEYNTAEAETPAGATVSDNDQIYITALYKIPESNFSIVGRYENYEDNTVTAAAKALGVEDDADVFTAGINWEFEKNARLQLSREFTGGIEKDTDRTDLQLSVRF